MTPECIFTSGLSVKNEVNGYEIWFLFFPMPGSFYWAAVFCLVPIFEDFEPAGDVLNEEQASSRMFVVRFAYSYR